MKSLTTPRYLSCRAAEATLTRDLEAYFYQFEPTGDDGVDSLLEAFAAAGKWAQSTADWCDELDVDFRVLRAGETPADGIQRIAYVVALNDKRQRGRAWNQPTVTIAADAARDWVRLAKLVTEGCDVDIEGAAGDLASRVLASLCWISEDTDGQPTDR